MTQPLRQLGPYLLTRELGRGGMGVVYQAHHPEIPDRQLAIKLILPGAANPSDMARFQREAESLGKFRHPNVVHVHGFYDSPQGPFLVTDMVPGEDLAEVCKKRGELEYDEAALLAQKLAGAVRALHDAGVLHRDLKPQNVILTPDGNPVLLDFGLARQQGAQQLTQTGTLLGTPAYMPPEQAGGDPVDERADVYALGAILYFLLTGEAPYKGGAVQVLHQVLKPELSPSPSSSRAGLPPGLERICQTAMAKDLQQRYPSAKALEQALGDYLQGPPPSMTPLRLLVAAGLIVVVSTAVFLSRGDPDLPESPFALRALLAKDDAPDGAERTSRWLETFPDHPERSEVLGIQHGYLDYQALLAQPLPSLESLAAWRETHTGHALADELARLEEGAEALFEVLRELPLASPREAADAFDAWREANPNHIAMSWAEQIRRDCDTAVRALDEDTVSPSERFHILRAWEVAHQGLGHPALPSERWFREAYRGLSFDHAVWQVDTTANRPRARFLPTPPLRFVTWGYENWKSYEPLRVWRLDPAAEDPVTLVSETSFEDALVLDLAIAPDGDSLSLLLGLRDTPGREQASGLVPHFELEGARPQVHGTALVANSGVRFESWLRWVVRADTEDEEPLLVCGGNRDRDPAPPPGSDERRTEGLLVRVQGEQVDQQTSDMHVRCLALSDDGSLLAVGAGDFNTEHVAGERLELKAQRVTMHATTPTLPPLHKNANFAATPGHLAFLPGSHQLVVCTNAHNVHLLSEELLSVVQLQGEDTETRFGVGIRPAHNAAARGHRVEGRLLLSIAGESGADLDLKRLGNEIRVWSRDDLEGDDLELWRRTAQPKGFFYVSLAPGGRWLLLGTDHGVELRQWRTDLLGEGSPGQ